MAKKWSGMVVQRSFIKGHSFRNRLYLFQVCCLYDTNTIKKIERDDVKTEEGYKKSYRGYLPLVKHFFFCGINQKLG